MNPYTTDELTPPHTDENGSLPPLNPPPVGAVRYIDIHVYDQPAEEEEEQSVESTLDQRTLAEPSSEQDSDQTLSLQFHWYATLVPSALAVACLALIATILIVMVILPLFAPYATITMIPVSKEISTTTTITITNGAPSAPGSLAGRALPSITMSQAKSFQTTGNAHQEARAASGLVIFYNAAPYTQTVAAGTVLTGADGTQIVTDQDAVIPAATYPQFGQATITAHAAVTGPAGNIQAEDIYGPCCRLNISAVNAAFRGGQRSRDYHTVTKQDIVSATSSLSTSLQQSVRVALQTQIQPGETLVTPLFCTQTVASEHPADAEATENHVTVNETCTGMTYPTQGYELLTSVALAQAAQKQLGTGYALVEPSQGTIAQVLMKHGALTLQVHLMGAYVYQFSPDQQAHLKALIAGKSKTWATAQMLKVPGIQSVSITTKNGERLPIDTAHIQMIFVMLP